MPEKKKRDQFEVKMNLAYELKLLFDKPITGDNEFGPWFLYAVKVMKAPEGDKACIAGNEYSWFPSEYANDLIVGTGARKGDVIKVVAEQDGKKTRWSIDREGGPLPVQASPKSSPGQPPPPDEPPPDFAEMRENAKAAATQSNKPPQAQSAHHVEGPKPPEPGPGSRPARNGNGKVKHGWMRESIAEEIRWWCDKCNKVIAEFAEENDGTGVEMSYDEVCKFYNTGLIQALRGQPPEIKSVATEVDLVGLWELVDDSLELLGLAPDPVLIEAWPEKFKDLIRLLPEEQREQIRKRYKTLPK